MVRTRHASHEQRRRRRKRKAEADQRRGRGRGRCQRCRRRCRRCRRRCVWCCNSAPACRHRLGLGDARGLDFLPHEEVRPAPAGGVGKRVAAEAAKYVHTLNIVKSSPARCTFRRRGGLCERSGGQHPMPFGRDGTGERIGEDGSRAFFSRFRSTLRIAPFHSWPACPKSDGGLWAV